MREKEQILKMLAKGTITVAQAKELLDALDYEAPQRKKKNTFFIDVDKAMEGLSGLGKSVGNFVSETFSELFDRDFNFQIKGSFDHFQKLQTRSLKDVENPALEIVNENGFVRLEETDSDELSIQTTVYYKDMTVTEGYHFFSLDEENGKYIYRATPVPDARHQYYLEILVKLPNKKFQSLSVKTSNAPIYGKNFETEHLELSTANGKIEVHDFLAQKVFLSTANSSITMENAQGENSSLQSSNGKIHLEDNQFKSLNVHTSNGRIHGEVLDMEELSLSTSNGAIRLERLSTKTLSKVHLQSSNGGLYLSLNELDREARFDLSTTSGNVHLNIPVDINADFTKETFVKNKHIQGATSGFKEGEEGIDFVLSTTNASIVIEKA